jgi:ArsR family transcriptional regulator, cadmium/lead-responsive transcriptional repressor
MTDERPDWMEPIDDEILERLRDGEVFMPKQIAEGIDARSPRVAYRCRELSTYGLVTTLATGMYDLSEQGRRYLENELDPNQLDPEDA